MRPIKTCVDFVAQNNLWPGPILSLSVFISSFLFPIRFKTMAYNMNR